MIKAEEKILFTQVRHQRKEIIAPPLQLEVLPFSDVIDSHVEAGTAGSSARDLFTQKEIGIAPQSFCRIDGIMIGNRDQVHASAFECCVDFQRIVVAFAADAAEQRNRTHSRMNRMHMQIATHALVLRLEALQRCELVITIGLNIVRQRSPDK